MSFFDKSDNVFNGNKIHFIAYGDKHFNSAKKNIFQQAKLTNWFSSISILSMDDLDQDFKEEFKDMILPKAKWYVWKFKKNGIQIMFLIILMYHLMEKLRIHLSIRVVY